MKTLSNQAAMLASALLLLMSCKGTDDRKNNDPDISVTTAEATEVTAFSATVGGLIEGTAELKERGVCWGMEANPDTEGNKIADIDPVEGRFTVQINTLEPSTKYFTRAYAIASTNETIYGGQVEFTTPEVRKAAVSNCYPVLPGATIAIPVSRANETLLGQQIKSGDKLSADLVWMDNLDVISTVKVFGQGPEAALVVIAGQTNGNALIALKSSGKIVWSWHIWVTAAADSFGTITMPSGSKLMDRNLGAVSTVASEIGTVGVQFQFGRHEPFTASASFGTPADVLMYDMNGNNPEIALTDGPKDLAFATENPLTYIKSQYVDWCSTNNPGWWADSEGSKTVYDPCPEGWRVPALGDFAEIADACFNKEVQGGWMFIFNGQSNFFPFTGYREVSGAMDATANYGTFWANAPLNEGAAFSPTYGVGGAQGVNGAPRSRALSIRCLRIQ